MLRLQNKWKQRFTIAQLMEYEHMLSPKFVGRYMGTDG
jgi:hypothetical protein